MGLFTSIKMLRAIKKQARAMQDSAGGVAGEGVGPGKGLTGSLGQLGEMLTQAQSQLEALGAAQSDRARLMSEGLDATATIVSTGVPARDAALYNLTIDLEVRIPGRDAYRVANQYMVPATARIGPGVTVPVKVDAADPARIAIDWDRAPSAPAMGEIRPVNPEP